MKTRATKTLVLRKNHTKDLSELVSDLLAMGYSRTESVQTPSQFSVNGGVVTIFAVNYSVPIVIDFFGNTVDSIYQSSTGKSLSFTKFPKIEINPNILVLEDKTIISPENFVVHDDHGIGVFSYLEKRTMNNEEVDYICISYLNNDVLRVPSELIDKISPYIGVGKKSPRLNRLGSVTWKKTYQRVYENIILFARELLNVYAQREIILRAGLTINQEWEEEVKASFPYKETPDQKSAIEALFEKLTKETPLDFLICGDVGFGKTEVAIRAAVQFCANGYQVAFICPTTILAEQHFATLSGRLSKLPIHLGHFSRLVDDKELKYTREGLSNGSLDIVIGTHGLLNEKIKFKNLGLLVLDEEQKFGVKDKEALKKLRPNIDVISLTATPIPRTLFMSLSGLKDILRIYSSPVGRKEIDTKVLEENDELVKGYIEREISRGGQVYYLHNEVATIVGKKNKLAKMFPNLKIGIAHGRMGEQSLAESMKNFASGKIDVLVSSTIIENGLDIPNANTLIVDHSEKFGLSQLYQIRGRIGRSPQKAYSLFLYSKKSMTNNAHKRLKALLENTEIGGGYNIALSDLEIRGGGNILGKEQHGNMETVGLVLYSKMLEKAVSKLKNKKI